MMLVVCPPQSIEPTLDHLREAGRRNSECVVLWLGQRGEREVEVREVFRPQQLAKSDVFRIPPPSMQQLHEHLRKNRLMVAAQVHSHPHKAFHSEADDRWAIIRHEGALSLVVPYFASTTTTANFLGQTMVYRFSPSAEWKHVPLPEVSTCLQIS